ncbi:MAG: ATP-binding protein [Methylophilus sp.]|nr:ATP-binding protein [Methylophilus sp.]
MEKLEHLITRAESLISKLELLLPAQAPAIDWETIAWRWIKHHGQTRLQAIHHPYTIALDNIQFVDRQKAEIVRNTEQFLQSLPANHVLLTGARGTGKSSLIKGLLSAFSTQGLRLIEVEKQDLVDLPEIVGLIRHRPEKFIIYCDDLTFEANDTSYKALKVILDGSLEHASSNVLVYATSNRKNLMPEFMADNLPNKDFSGEIRPSDTIEEKTALAERFGLWLSFYSFDQEEYLAIATHWLSTFNLTFDDVAKQAALSFSHTRGARSGRVAYQFAKDYAGKRLLNVTS